MAGLLGNKNAVVLLLKFLEIIDVKNREKAKEKNIKLERKKNELNKELFD